MMLAFCEAPHGSYKEVICVARKRLETMDDSLLRDAVADGLLDDDYSKYELKESDLYNLDNPLAMYLRAQVMEAVDIVLISMDTSLHVTTRILDNKSWAFTGGQTLEEFPSDIFRNILIIEYFNLFRDMGSKDFDYEDCNSW